MRSSTSRLAVFGVLLGGMSALLSSAAQADGMYCGSRIVSRGDTLYQVRSICGEPDDAQHRVETRTERHRVRVPCGRQQAQSSQSFAGQSPDARAPEAPQPAAPQPAAPQPAAPQPAAQCETVVERSTDVVVDDWTYDLGRQRLVRFLTFIDGRLSTVQTGGYGSRDDR